MSIQFNGTTSGLVYTLPTALTIGTGDFSALLSFRLDSLPSGDMGDLFSLLNPGFTSFIYAGVAPAGTLKAIGPTFSTPTAIALTTQTWYTAVVGRTGTVFHLRMFDDTASTTPVGDTSIADTGSATGIDAMRVGTDDFGGFFTPMQAGLLKVHTGVYWTNAQCRTETQNYGIQTAGGTDRFCWAMQDQTLSRYGLAEWNGGPVFVNTACSASAHHPRQLQRAPLVRMRMGT